MNGEKPRYLLDANAFDYLLDRAVDPRSVRALGEMYITDVQHGELLRVRDPRRRKRLLGVLAGIAPTVRPAPFDLPTDAPRGDGRGGVSGAPRGAPSDAARRFRGAARRLARWKDAAMGEIAQLEGYVLVTDDKRFRARAVELGVSALSCDEAFADLERLTPPPRRRARHGGRSDRGR